MSIEYSIFHDVLSMNILREVMSDSNVNHDIPLGPQITEDHKLKAIIGYFSGAEGWDDTMAQTILDQYNDYEKMRNEFDNTVSKLMINLGVKL